MVSLYIDGHLTFADHIRTTVQKCHGILGALRCAAPSLPKELLRLAYIALVRSHLEYCSGVLISMAMTHSGRLEVVQKIAARIICNAPRNAHSAPLLEELHLEPLLNRRIKHVCDIVSRCLDSRCHPALLDYFCRGDDGSVSLSGMPATNNGKKRFQYTAAQLYNEQKLLNTH